MTYQCNFADLEHKSITECKPGKDSTSIVVKNFGLTPALHLEVCNVYWPIKPDETFDEKAAFHMVIDGCRDHLQKIRAISPSESVVSSAFLTADALMSLRKSAVGGGTTFLVSTIVYTDVFGDQHRSNFCGGLNGNFGAGAVVDCGGDGPENY